MKKDPAIMLLFDSNRGTYIPQNFVEDETLRTNFGLNESNKEKWEACLNHDNEDDSYNEGYWEAWEWILDNAKHKSERGEFVICQKYEGDVWALDVDRMTTEEKENFELGDN